MLFSASKGIGLTVLRQPMGASDFALEDYCYDDMLIHCAERQRRAA
jgi:hypothetical protein